MAIAYESIATTDFNEVSPGTLTITKPTGLAVGDMMIANLVWNSNDTEAPTLPSGWTQLFHSTTGTKSAMAYKVADSGDVAASNFVFTLAGTVSASGGSIMRWSGVGQIDAGSVYRDLSTTATPTFTTGVTPSVADSYLLFIYYCEFTLNAVGSYAITTNNPTWVEVAQETNVSPDLTMAIAYASRPETTATGNFSCTTENSIGSHFGRLIVLSPTTNVNLSMPVINVTSSLVAPSLTIDVNFQMPTIDVSSSLVAPTIKVNEKTQWIDTEKGSKTWTDTKK